MSLDEAYAAIEAGEIESARTLLRPLMQENQVEAFYLASRVAYTQEQALEFLRYALQLEPGNDAVREALTELETLYNTQQAIIPVHQSTLAIQEKLEKTAAIFQQHGWQLVEQSEDMVHVTRRRSTSAASAFLMGLFFHIPGLLLNLWSVLSSEKIHIFIEADEEALLITSNKMERLITKPQQAILIIESLRGVTVRQAILWGLIGVLFSTLLWWGLYWYVNHQMQNFEAYVQELQATLTAAPDIQRQF